MGTRLRNIRKKEKLGGEKRLTEGVIKKLTIYYGLSITRNIDSTQEMRKVIIATLDHYCSTDESPRHENCSTGVVSWCEWRKVKSMNKHPARLDEKIEKHISPIYEKFLNNA